MAIGFFGLPVSIAIAAAIAIVSITTLAFLFFVYALLLLKASRFNADAVQRRIDPDERFPEGAASIESCELELVELGFEPLAHHQCTDFLPFTGSDTTFMLHKPTHTAALIMATYRVVREEPVSLQHVIVEFGTETTTRELSTVRSTHLGEMFLKKHRSMLHVGSNWNLAQVLAVHQERVRRTEEALVSVGSRDHLVAELETQGTETFARWEASGLVRPCEDQMFTHQYTLRGACVATWKILNKGRRLKRDARKAQRIWRSIQSMS